MLLLRLLWRNAFRHRLRAALTILAMAVAVLAFCLLRTLVDAWYVGVAGAAANRLVVRNAISLTFFLPIAYAEKIRAVDGVRALTHMTWFGGIYLDRKNFFANFAVDARTYFDLYPEFVLSREEREAFARDRKGCVVGAGLARRFGWKLGDAVTLEGTIFAGQWPLTVRGIYRGRDPATDEAQLFFHWDYLNERLAARAPRRANWVGIFVVAVDDPDAAPEVGARIDALFRSSLAETLSETERAFQLGFVAMSEAILMAIRLVALVIIAIIMAVVANTMLMSVRERLREFAVLKTLGFGPGRLAAMILGEAAVICAAGGALGVAAAYPTLALLSDRIGDLFPVLGLSPLTLRLAAAAAAAVALVGAAFPIRRVLGIRIVEGLGRVA